MAGTDLEEFVVYSSEESITPTAEYEGTNASRFAIVGALTAPAPRTLGDRISPIGDLNLERFGFNPDFVFRAALDQFESADLIREEAGAFLERRGSWLNGEGRSQAWSELAYQGNLQTRLMLLAAGVTSELERESAAAAVAIIGVLRNNLKVGDLGRGPWIYFPPWRWRPWSEEWPWTWVDSSGPPQGEPLDDFDQQTAPWYGVQWRQFAEEVVAVALDSADEQILLSVLLWIAALRVEDAARSGDDVVREFASSARWSRSDDTPGDIGAALLPQVAQPSTSTMLHGTWGWKGDWWYPGGDFHSYVKRKLRPRLYGDGMEFSWSGAYSQKQRVTASERFSRWVRSHAPTDGLGTVFAHSYGGEVAARAINSGARVHELVLLSAPVNMHHRAAIDRVSRIIDVRLKFDIVLTLARESQRMPRHSKVTECIVDRAFWSHGATHTPEFWDSEGINGQVGL